MNTTKTAFCLSTALVLLSCFSSCRKMEIDTDQRREIITGLFPIDTIDKFHQWDLLQTKSVSVSTDIDDNISRVQLLSGNPYASSDVEILAEKYSQTNDYVGLIAELPKSTSTTGLYAAAVNRYGKYYVVPVGSKSAVNFSSGDVIAEGDFHEPSYQTFTYLFEQDFPLPGDFDFNDVVLRVSKSMVSSNILKLQVTLAAVGSQAMLGAAVRLCDINYDDVESVTIDEGTRFDEDYPIERFYIDNEALWVSGIDGSLVVNLFEDAHWSLNPETENGMVKRLYYNTRTYEKADECAKVPTKTRTYTIRLKDAVDVTNKSLFSRIDPFIIETSYGINMEVHTYRYKYNEAIWRYTSGDGSGDDDHVAWALLIPDGTFHYPLEELPIGHYRNGEVSGVYCRYNHSFGQWGRNCQTSLDWWQYANATKSQVY